MKQDSLIVFLHIPKCAGTSISAAIAEHFGRENCYYYGKNEPYKRYEQSAPNLGQFQFVKGHLTLDQVNLIRGPKKIFTLMREPVERVLSWFEFMARQQRTTLHPFASSGDAHTFIQKCLDAQADPDSPRSIKKNVVELSNGMCQRLTGSENADLAVQAIKDRSIKVLDQGKLDTEASELWGWLGLPELAIPQLNTAPRKKEYPKSVIERIRELNTEDAKLYEALFPQH